MKLLLINPTFTVPWVYKRWEDLSKKHNDLDITLLAPCDKKRIKKIKNENCVNNEQITDSYDKDNFHIRTIDKISFGKLGLLSRDMIKIIIKEKPDVVYHIGEHRQLSVLQLILLKKYKMKNILLYIFSMRGPQYNISNILVLKSEDNSLLKKTLRLGQYFFDKYKVNMINKHVDAVFCHYPEGMNCFKKEGYKGPIFMQTQVGVDVDIYHKDKAARNKMRKELRIGESYLFASAVRLDAAKGVDKVLDALPVNGDWKYLIMGKGTIEEIDVVKKKIKERCIEDKVLLIGFVEQTKMCEYWNAVDCAIHFAQTTSKWEETFSLAITQAMATGVPVIGSSSGSVPYQIGFRDMIVDENDIQGLHNKMQWAIDNQDEMIKIGQKMSTRTIESFSTKHLNELFYNTIISLTSGHDIKDYIDMTNTSIKY